MSLKARLALFFALSIGLALFFQGALSYVAFKGLIEADLDRSLLFYARALAEGRPGPRGEFAFRLVQGGTRTQSPGFPDLPPLPRGGTGRRGGGSGSWRRLGAPSPWPGTSLRPSWPSPASAWSSSPRERPSPWPLPSSPGTSPGWP